MTSTMTDVAPAVERARDWLISVHAEATQGSDSPVSLLLHTTLGLWLCETAFGIGDTRPTIVEISARLGDMERQGGLERDTQPLVEVFLVVAHCIYLRIPERWSQGYCGERNQVLRRYVVNALGR